MRVGVIADTHGYLDPQIFEYFKDVNLILHAGDVGNPDIINTLQKIAPVKGVYGNIDDYRIREEFPEQLTIVEEECKICMQHIAGRPGKYNARVRNLLQQEDPDIFICGHSHITLVKFVEDYQMLHINPGAAGYHGFHKERTAIRFRISARKYHDLELIKLGSRGKIQ